MLFDFNAMNLSRSDREIVKKGELLLVTLLLWYWIDSIFDSRKCVKLRIFDQSLTSFLSNATNDNRISRVNVDNFEINVDNFVRY